MKKIKKLLAVVIVAVMVLAMGIPTMAANDGSITVDNATVGEGYHIYKVFDLTYSGVGETSTGTEGGDPLYSGVAYTYLKSSDPDAFYNALIGAASPFDLEATTTPNVYNVTIKTGKTGEDVSSFLKTNESYLTPTSATTTGLDASGIATATTIKWTSLEYGYYYVTSTLGATVTIDSTLKDVIVKDKNTIPTQDKKQATGTTEPADKGDYDDAEKTVQVGDKVWYQIEVKDGKGTNSAITIEDTMTDGLTYNSDIKIKASINGAAETDVDPGNYTFIPLTNGFQIEFSDSYVQTLTEHDYVYIRYSATVDSKAASDVGADKETNTSKLTYSAQTSTETVDVVTYKFQLDKTDATYTELYGAKFELYRGSVDPANKLYFKSGTDEGGVPVLIVVPSGTLGAFSEIQLTNDSADVNYLNNTKVIIKGLDKADYILRETAAPSGYNKAADETVLNTILLAIDGTITDNAGIATDIGVVTVVNNTGTELPSTGGMGTTVLYIVGIVLVAGAVILFVTRRRMNSEK